MKCLLLPAEGDITIVEGEVIPFNQARKLVGGLITQVPIVMTLTTEVYRFTIWCDEDGDLKGLPPNKRLRSIRPAPSLVGTVLFTGYDIPSESGYLRGLPDDQIDAIWTLLDPTHQGVDARSRDDMI